MDLGARRIAALIVLVMIIVPGASPSRVGAAAPAETRAYRSVSLGAERTMKYALVLPDGFDPAKEYPALLALPPGPQTEAMVEEGLKRYWEAGAKARGWVVVSPVVPDGATPADFTTGARSALPLLLIDVAGQVKIEGGMFHLAGVSNGGRSAFAAAIDHPSLYASLTVLPGYPAGESDASRLGRLLNMPITFLVGERDRRWREETDRAVSRLIKTGQEPRVIVIPDQGHQLDLEPAMLFDLLDSRRAVNANGGDRTPENMAHRPGPYTGGGGAGAPAPGAVGGAEAAVHAVLDALHDAASKADGPRYFALFDESAVFLGTDASERWSITKFREYAEARFATGKGWTYRVKSRHVSISPAGDAAWFDEMLMNDKYGECRGSGVLLLREGGWKVAQYNLLAPIPNDMLPEVARLIRAFDRLSPPERRRLVERLADVASSLEAPR